MCEKWKKMCFIQEKNFFFLGFLVQTFSSFTFPLKNSGEFFCKDSFQPQKAELYFYCRDIL